MADNFLEYHREEYDKRKSRWLAKQKSSINKAIVQKYGKKTRNEAAAEGQD